MDNPLELCEYYSKLWHELNSIEDIEKRKEYYCEMGASYLCPKRESERRIP